MATTDIVNPTTPIVNGAPVSSTNPMPVYMPLGGFLPLSGGTLTGTLSLPTGSTTVPSLNFGDATTGFSGGTGISLIASGAGRVRFTTADVRAQAAMVYGWSGGAITAAADTGFSRTAAGVVALGNGTTGNTSGTLTANIRVTNAYVAGATVATGTITIQDSTGTTYRVPVLV